MKKYTIQDLADGKCAVINDGTLEELTEVLRRAFPEDITTPEGFSKLYLRWGDADVWKTEDKTDLPTQSVKDFLVEEEPVEVIVENFKKKMEALGFDVDVKTSKKYVPNPRAELFWVGGDDKQLYVRICDVEGKHSQDILDGINGYLKGIKF